MLAAIDIITVAQRRNGEHTLFCTGYHEFGSHDREKREQLSYMRICLL
jgi:hypothetical protein